MYIVKWIVGLFLLSQLIALAFLEWMNRAMGGKPWSLFKREP